MRRLQINYGTLWFRIGPFCVEIKDTTKVPLRFSERNGYVPTYRIGKYAITVNNQRLKSLACNSELQ
jgi:hypothetical protein